MQDMPSRRYRAFNIYNLVKCHLLLRVYESTNGCKLWKVKNNFHLFQI